MKQVRKVFLGTALLMFIMLLTFSASASTQTDDDLIPSSTSYNDEQFLQIHSQPADETVLIIVPRSEENQTEKKKPSPLEKALLTHFLISDSRILNISITFIL